MKEVADGHVRIRKVCVFACSLMDGNEILGCLFCPPELTFKPGKPIAMAAACEPSAYGFAPAGRLLRVP